MMPTMFILMLRLKVSLSINTLICFISFIKKVRFLLLIKGNSLSRNVIPTNRIIIM